MALMITIGDTNKDYLRLKVPAKGEQNWSQEFKTEFALKIAEHDHTGNGKGLQITTEALKDNAVTGAKLNANINDLNDVAVSTASAGNILRYNGSVWVGEPQEATSNVLTIDEQDNTVYSWEPEMLDNVYMYLSGGEDADLTAKSTSSAGDPIVIDSVIITAYSPDSPRKQILLPAMKNCIIKGKVNLNVQGNLENCIIDIDGDIFTNALYGFDSCTIKANSIQNLAAASNSTNTVFTNCKIDVQTMTSDLTAGDTNKIKFVDSIVNVANSFSNSSALDITDLNTAHLELDNSHLRVNGRLENLFGFLLDADSFIIAENYAENNKERVSLTLNRLDIGLFTKTIKDVDIRLNIDLTGENILSDDPITSYTEYDDGSVEIGNYVKQDGNIDTGNWWRSYASFFNLGTSLDNVTMEVSCENYTYNNVVMNPNNDKHLHVLYMPKVIKDSKLVFNEIEGLDFKHHSSVFQVHENQDFSNYTGTDYTVSAPARFQIVHTGQVKLLNTTISQNRGNEIREQNYDSDTIYFGCQYRLLTDLQNPINIMSEVYGCTFNNTSVIFRDSVHVEECTSLARNFYIGDDSQLNNCNINTYNFRIDSPNDPVLSGFKCYRTTINTFNFYMNQNPSDTHDVVFSRCHINAVTGQVRTGVPYGIFFHDCNLNFSSYFRNLSDADEMVVMQYSNFKTPWVGKSGYQTRIYCLDSNLDIGKIEDRCDIMNYQSKVEIGKVISGLIYFYKNYGGDNTTYGTGSNTSTGFTTQGSRSAPFNNIIFGIDGAIASSSGEYSYLTKDAFPKNTTYRLTNNVSSSLVYDFNDIGYVANPTTYTVNKVVSSVQTLYDSGSSHPDVENYDGATCSVSQGAYTTPRAIAHAGASVRVKITAWWKQSQYIINNRSTTYNSTSSFRGSFKFYPVFKMEVFINNSLAWSNERSGSLVSVTGNSSDYNWEDVPSAQRNAVNADITMTNSWFPYSLFYRHG